MMEHEEIKASISEAAKHKRGRPYVKRALADIDAKADRLARKIASGRWFPPKHKRTLLQEGSHKKKREIEKPQWDDEQIVHHMLMRQFRECIIPRSYKYACGVIPGRGALYAARALKRWRDEYNGKKFYVAELDIKKFYDNVDLGLLKASLGKFIRDKKFLEIMYRVIDHSSPGLPKGYYTSPWLAHFVMMPFDNYVAQTLRPDHYLRYVDNIYLFGRNKRELHRMVENIIEYLDVHLHLALNDSRQIFRMEHRDRFSGRIKGRAINALGFVIHYNRVTMRKSILERSRAKANRMHRLHRCRRCDAATMLSYKGWYKHTDTYNYYQKWIKPKISMHYCRRRLSKLAKRERSKLNDRLVCSA